MELSDHLHAKPLSPSNSLWLLSTWTPWHEAGLSILHPSPLSAIKALCFFSVVKTHLPTSSHAPCYQVIISSWVSRPDTSFKGFLLVAKVGMLQPRGTWPGVPNTGG